MQEAYFDIPFELKNPLETRIADAFWMFDRNAVNMIDGRDVGPVLRSLGCVPTKDDVDEIIKRTEFSNHPGNIHLTKFISCLKSYLAEHKMKPSQPEVLLEAFKTLDHHDKGFIHADVFRKFFTDIGEPMNEEELNVLFKSSIDPTDNRVYYEAYIKTLVHEPDDSIYKLADDIATLGPRASRLKLNVMKKEGEK